MTSCIKNTFAWKLFLLTLMARSPHVRIANSWIRDSLLQVRLMLWSCFSHNDDTHRLKFESVLGNQGGIICLSHWKSTVFKRLRISVHLDRTSVNSKRTCDNFPRMHYRCACSTYTRYLSSQEDSRVSRARTWRHHVSTCPFFLQRGLWGSPCCCKQNRVVITSKTILFFVVDLRIAIRPTNENEGWRNLYSIEKELSEFFHIPLNHSPSLSWSIDFSVLVQWTCCSIVRWHFEKFAAEEVDLDTVFHSTCQHRQPDIGLVIYLVDLMFTLRE